MLAEESFSMPFLLYLTCSLILQAYTTKLTAGGWNYLTYFGRDTMISLRILLPLMTSAAAEDAFGAILERTNSTGALCHEVSPLRIRSLVNQLTTLQIQETIGDYASFVNIQDGEPQLGGTTWLSYVMVDEDLLNLLALSHYLLETPQGAGRGPEFLAQTSTLSNTNGSTYLELLLL
jgi:hypothetical protein